jgi:hypothetical protein
MPGGLLEELSLRARQEPLYMRSYAEKAILDIETQCKEE